MAAETLSSAPGGHLHSAETARSRYGNRAAGWLDSQTCAYTYTEIIGRTHIISCVYIHVHVHVHCNMQAQYTTERERERERGEGER